MHSCTCRLCVWRCTDNERLCLSNIIVCYGSGSREAQQVYLLQEYANAELEELYKSEEIFNSKGPTTRRARISPNANEQSTSNARETSVQVKTEPGSTRRGRSKAAAADISENGNGKQPDGDDSNLDGDGDGPTNNNRTMSTRRSEQHKEEDEVEVRKSSRQEQNRY